MLGMCVYNIIMIPITNMIKTRMGKYQIGVLNSFTHLIVAFLFPLVLLRKSVDVINVMASIIQGIAFLALAAAKYIKAVQLKKLVPRTKLFRGADRLICKLKSIERKCNKYTQGHTCSELAESIKMISEFFEHVHKQPDCSIGAQNLYEVYLPEYVKICKEYLKKVQELYFDYQTSNIEEVDKECQKYNAGCEKQTQYIREGCIAFISTISAAVEEQDLYEEALNVNESLSESDIVNSQNSDKLYTSVQSFVASLPRQIKVLETDVAATNTEETQNDELKRMLL